MVIFSRISPATDTTDDMEELFLVKAGRKPGGGDTEGDTRGFGAWVSAGPLGLSPMASAVTTS